MRALLFRKLVINGVNYYQLFNQIDDFKPDDSFANFENRNEKDYFYLGLDNDVHIEDHSLLNIFYDDKGKFVCLQNPKIFEKVFNEFKEKYNISIHKLKEINEIVSDISSNILFQDEAINDLTGQLYFNQEVMTSDLPLELKVTLKNNILFHGPIGSGKKSIVELLEKELDIPYADIKINGDLKNSLESILIQLKERSKNEEEASHGIVFIRDNFLDLMSTFGEKVYSVPTFFTDQGIISYNGFHIDFRTLSFVILFDERKDVFEDTDIQEVLDMTNCTYCVTTNELTNDEKYQILFSKNGRLTHYKRFLNEKNKEFYIDEAKLKELIVVCSKIDPGMGLIHSIIDTIMKYSLLNGVGDVYISDSIIGGFIPTITEHTIQDNKEKIASIVENILEPSPNEVFDQYLAKVFKEITSDVIGQDAKVKLILYHILLNQRMANKTDLKNPKNFIKKILIRGESGSGKTMIIEKIAELLNIPTFIADATDYTEEGWAGDNVRDMLVHLYHNANDDLEKAQKGILFIDEIDKKANSDGHSGPSRVAVLCSLLKSLDGAKIPINVGTRIDEQKIMFDTTRLTVVCSGAFEGLEEIRDIRIGKRKAGFGSDDNKKDDEDITDEDYITYGINKEFIGRLLVEVELNKCTIESLVNIMKHSESSPLKIEQYILEDRGIELEYTDEFCIALAERALKAKEGARGITKALMSVFKNIHIEDIEARKVSKVILDKDVINDPSKIIIIPREKEKTKVYRR